MALAAELRALLAGMAQAGVRPVEEMDVAGARRAAREFLLLQGAPEEVAWTEEHLLPRPGPAVRVRLHYPAGDGPFPCLVYFHGGGWVTMDIDVCDPAARALANATGCVVAAVDYRKAPEHRFPAAVDDAWSATCWVAGRAAELNLDPARIGVVGDSSGGNLAAVTALRARDEGGPAIAFQILVHPPTCARADEGSAADGPEALLLHRRSMRWFYRHYADGTAEWDDPRLSPLCAEDLSGLPRALVVTAEHDPLRGEGRRYAERLAEAGTPAVHSDHLGAAHGLYLMAGVLAAGRRLHQEIAAEVREAAGLA